MKVIKKIGIFILLCMMIGLSIGLLVIGEGFDQYKKAREEIALDKKIESIRNQDNYIRLKKLPSCYIEAVVSVEDHRFWKHKGIDIIAIARATMNDLKAMKLKEGGSTITQQLAKNLYFTQEKHFSRKIAEVFMAFEIEKNYSKEEILELYVNTIYFGEGYYGIQEASQGYFKKEPQDMTDDESILLAGIPNAPSDYSLTKNAQLARQRQKQVLEKMVSYGYLTREEANNIINTK